MRVKSTIHRSNPMPVMFWILSAYMLAFLFVAPFYRGLFNGGQASFEGPIYIAILTAALALAVVGISWLKRFDLSEVKGLLSVVIWLIPLGSAISAAGAASPHLATNSLFTHVLYASVFIIALEIATFRQGMTLLANGFLLSGYVIVLYGFLNWFGQAEYQDAVIGLRLSGVFQYPNTYAAFLTALLVATVWMAQIGRKWYISGLYLLMLVPLMTSFLLTLSRGGILLLPAVVIIYLFMISWKKQLLSLVPLSVATGISLLLMQPLLNMRSQLVEAYTLWQASLGWGLLFIGSLIPVLVALLVKLAMRKWSKKSESEKPFSITNLVAPALLLLFSLLAVFMILGESPILDFLPEPLKSRVAKIQLDEKGVLSRTTFVVDSIKILKDYPLFGAGGGAWQVLYDDYKSYPYTSRQAHSFFFQYLNEVGIVGFSIFIVILGYILLRYVKWWFANEHDNGSRSTFLFLIVAITFLAHSMIDFDMSYVYVGVLTFVSFGVMGAAVGNGKFVELVKRWVEKRNVMKGIKIAVPVLVMLVAVVTLIYSQKAIKADRSFADALSHLNKSVHFNQVMEPLNEALKLRPGHPEYANLKAGLLRDVYMQTGDETFFEQASQVMDQIRKKEPHQVFLDEMQYTLYVSNNAFEEAIAILSEQMKAHPWNIRAYDRWIDLMFQLGIKAIDEGNQVEADRYWNEALRVYDDVLDKREAFDSFPKAQRNISLQNFKLLTNSVVSVAKIHYFNQQYEDAAATLRPILVRRFDDPINREVARWLLASLQKQGKNNRKLYDQLVEADASEAKKIEALLQATP